MTQEITPIVTLAPGLDYCVYAHLVDGVIRYVGMGSVSRAFSLRPAERNNAWRDGSAGKAISVALLAFFHDKRDALDFEKSCIDRYDPHWNGSKYAVGAKHTRPPPSVDGPLRRVRRVTRVMCDQTGEVFANGTAAAKAMGLSQGAVSNVLNGRYESVGGYTFSRVFG